MLRGVWAKLKVSSVMLIWKCLGEETPNLRFVAQIEQREITGAGSLDARLAACRCFQLYQPNVRYPSLPPCPSKFFISLFQTRVPVEIRVHAGADCTMHDRFHGRVVFRR